MIQDNALVQNLQNLAEQQEQNIVVGVALVSPMQQDPNPRIWEEVRAAELKNSETNFLEKVMLETFAFKSLETDLIFFTSMLLSLENFEWATEFLYSSATTHIFTNQGNTFFFIPKSCPVNNKVCVFTNAGLSTKIGSSKGEDQGEKNKAVIIQEIKETATPFKKRKTARRQTPIVKSQVRRSERVKT